MNDKINKITLYLRSAVAAQVNRSIDFKEDNYYDFPFEQFLDGKIDEFIYKKLLGSDIDNSDRDTINVIIVAKTIKTIFESQVKKNSDIKDLTGIFFIPAILKEDGTLYYSEGKLPWIPREFLQPLVEEILSVGHHKDFDSCMSKNIGLINKIKTWKDYINFAKDLYEDVTKANFYESKLSEIELEDRVYILKDNTINATISIMKLYDHLIDECVRSKLYENFLNLDFKQTSPLIQNGIDEMKLHCGQMGGEYPLSPSQRESINHFNYMQEGEVLAINGPPGTGKTTLLQSIVANMYVERALKKEKPPLIVASSTNNQAVTNIIESFGNINSLGYKNLEERWIEGVNSFAVYFPSSFKEKVASKQGYHYTNLKGDHFISEIENDENIEKSKSKLITNCNIYFDEKLSNIEECENKIHEVLCKINLIRKNLLDIVNEVRTYNIGDKNIEEFLGFLKVNIEDLKQNKTKTLIRVEQWRKYFKKMPILYKLLRFIKPIKERIKTRNRFFIDADEAFLCEDMRLVEIEEKYSYIIKDINKEIKNMTEIYDSIERLKEQYDRNLIKLKQLNIDIFKNKKNKYESNLEKFNEVLDTNLRYIQFWLSVHYYECRWASGEDQLTEKQKGTNYQNVIEKLYNRLSMVTPCYVMTFYQLPRNFLTYEGNEKTNYLYNYIDLLIIDEAGQVSPEIAACSFTLAKKALVVGDVHQIEPVWSVSRSLDQSLAMEYKIIENKEEYNFLEEIGINSASSSVMKVASKCCKYTKYNLRGLFLSEHRRCYNEIISYCNDLVYGGHLRPMRGFGAHDEEYRLKSIPQMGYRHINTDYSNKRGSSRFNKSEAIEIANWISQNFYIIKEAYPNEDIGSLIGVITPFKAQARYIEWEFERQIPDINRYISVGTVHTFQGAERRIIIMSSVYGKFDGCYFIDANRSMLNVAVSRAKDSFLVFGDIKCFKDDKSSASGLLKKNIINKFV